MSGKKEILVNVYAWTYFKEIVLNKEIHFVRKFKKRNKISLKRILKLLRKELLL